MKKLLILLGLLVALQTARAQTKSSHYTAAENLLVTMDMKQTMETSLDQMLQIQIQNNPGLKAAEPTLQAFFRKYMSWDALRDDLAKMYMSEFTEKELKEMNKFFATETGKKMAAKQSILMMKGAQIGQEKVKAHMGELQEMLQNAKEQP